MENKNQPAFPTGEETRHGYLVQGLSKREYAAITIMAALMGDPSRSGRPEDYAQNAIEAADALLEQLSKQ